MCLVPGSLCLRSLWSLPLAVALKLGPLQRVLFRGYTSGCALVCNWLLHGSSGPYHSDVCVLLESGAYHPSGLTADTVLASECPLSPFTVPHLGSLALHTLRDEAKTRIIRMRSRPSLLLWQASCFSLRVIPGSVCQTAHICFGLPLLPCLLWCVWVMARSPLPSESRAEAGSLTHERRRTRDNGEGRPAFLLVTFEQFDFMRHLSRLPHRAWSCRDTSACPNGSRPRDAAGPPRA